MATAKHETACATPWISWLPASCTTCSQQTSQCSQDSLTLRAQVGRNLLTAGVLITWVITVQVSENSPRALAGRHNWYNEKQAGWWPAPKGRILVSLLTRSGCCRQMTCPFWGPNPRTPRRGFPAVVTWKREQVSPTSEPGQSLLPSSHHLPQISPFPCSHSWVRGSHWTPGPEAGNSRTWATDASVPTACLSQYPSNHSYIQSTHTHQVKHCRTIHIWAKNTM